ncbi:hypothetical protein [Mobilicoccus pelagius]|uniref:Uncharacterized protein n=1 Tax=Mobilicoccus pelagius NBRC 104925 TaxID=1089455 RepID=H5UVH9_9MICO|nr:hypothetical protein [Mobilicoccus pelagius]GAB49737.1 hypothetical protein MOPEL_134_00210 [Mobilicoccus pelagius NBRC 104925]
MPESAPVVADGNVDVEVDEYVTQWSRLPHPLEAAVLDEVNEPDAVVRRAAEIIHRRPPGLEGSTRSVWVLAHCTPTGEGERRRLSSWCWYATRAAAEAAVAAARKAAPATDDELVLHEISVPRSVRCDGVAAHLGRLYRARPAEPRG